MSCVLCSADMAVFLLVSFHILGSQKEGLEERIATQSL